MAHFTRRSVEVKCIATKMMRVADLQSGYNLEVTFYSQEGACLFDNQKCRQTYTMGWFDRVQKWIDEKQELIATVDIESFYWENGKLFVDGEICHLALDDNNG